MKFVNVLVTIVSVFFLAAVFVVGADDLEKHDTGM